MAYTIVPEDNIKLSEVADMYGVACTLTACAVAAGLPTSNIKIGDFAGLTAAPSGGVLNSILQGAGWECAYDDFGEEGISLNSDGALNSSNSPSTHWLVDNNGDRVAVTVGDNDRYQILLAGHEHYSGDDTSYTVYGGVGTWLPITSNVGRSFWIENNTANKLQKVLLFFGIKDTVTGDSFDFEVAVSSDTFVDD